MSGQVGQGIGTIGGGYGLWLGIRAALTPPHTRVWLATWKRAMVLRTDTEQAQLRAMELFPVADLRRKKDHGRAEALLLAYYPWQMTAGTRRYLDMGKNYRGGKSRLSVPCSCTPR
jgi:hypothetical protein